MTCIAGISDPDTGQVWIGGDLSASTEYVQSLSAYPKVFRNEDMLIGFAGSFRFGQLLQHSLEIPEWRYDWKDDHEYMCTDFAHAVRECAVTNGFGTECGKSDSTGDDGVALIGFNQKLWILYTDYTVFQPLQNFAAIGSGDHHAMGSLMTTFLIDPDMDPEVRLKLALLSAGEYVHGCSKEYTIMVTDMVEEEESEAVCEEPVVPKPTPRRTTKKK